MDEKIINNIAELNDKRKKSEIVIQSVKELKLVKNSIWQYLISIIISIIISSFVAFGTNTVNISKEILEILLQTELAFAAMILGSYAVFQALLQGKILVELIKTKNNILKESNQTFLNLMILYIIGIVISIVTSIFMKIMNDNFYIVSIEFSNVLAFMLISLYLFFNFMLFLENINFVINLYRMINVHNIYKTFEELEKK